jgi:HK97 family phage portal protein
MAIVSSFGALQSLTSERNQNWWASSDIAGSVNLGDAFATYGEIYRTQPNVRIPVDFLSRNIAQLGLHTFRRVSDTDRVRLFDHQLSRWLKRPNPATTRYRLIESTVSDLAIYLNAFWLKLRYRDVDRTTQIGLVRLPPEQMTVSGGILPSLFTWTLEDGTEKDYSPADVVHFSGYNPDNPLIGLSGMETLRRVLAEAHAAGAYRESFWRNSTRFEGVIERPNMPAGKKDWNPDQRRQFRDGVRAFRQGGAKAGEMLVLEDGMQYKSISGDSVKNQYVEGLKLTREICAAAFHIPLPMVGILEHATFSNIKEQHKHLYQDCLGPWLVMIEEELERQLLTEATDQENVYLEFNIAEKLKGSFEEQAAALHALVGKPVMTANEGRARLNLPRMDDPEADKLAVQPGTGDAQLLEGEVVEDEPRRLPPAERDDEEAALQYQRLEAQIAALAARPTIINVAMPPIQIGETKIDAPVSITWPSAATRSVHTRDPKNGLITETVTSPVDPAGA